MKRIALILILLLPLLSAARKHHTGPGRLDAPASPEDVRDTVRTHLDSIAFSGYDKPNQAVREAFFVTNRHPDSITLSELCVTFTYFDMQGRMLHEAAHTVKCQIPPGATRRLEVPSWDRTNAFHYFLSPAPPRRQSSPYRVSSTLLYVLK